MMTIQAYAARHGIVPVAQGITCPFYQGGRCAVYPVRPRICQAYGHSERLRCSRGYAANVDESELKRWVQAAGEPAGTLHDLLKRAGT